MPWGSLGCSGSLPLWDGPGGPSDPTCSRAHLVQASRSEVLILPPFHSALLGAKEVKSRVAVPPRAWRQPAGRPRGCGLWFVPSRMVTGLCLALWGCYEARGPPSFLPPRDLRALGSLVGSWAPCVSVAAFPGQQGGLRKGLFPRHPEKAKQAENFTPLCPWRRPPHV